MKSTRSQAILLVDHGSRQQAANSVLEAVAALLSREAPEYHVEVSHMELAEPNIRQGLRRCVESGAREITVHPYMLGPGRHATQDIPRLVREALADFPHVICRVTKPLGVHPLLARVILERVREAENEQES